MAGKAKKKNIEEMKISEEEKMCLLHDPWKKTLPISIKLEKWRRESMDARVYL